MTRILIWNGHPRATSLSSALADAYQAGAEDRGAEIRRIDLSDMDFSIDFPGYTGSMPDLEPDLLAWQEAVIWAEHMFWVYPYWWGSMPAKMKAVLDRALLPGFGFKYHKGGLGWDKLLKGRTGDAMITSDTPPLWDTFVYRKPGRRVVRNQVFGFCGIRPRRIVQIGTVKTAKPEKIEAWITKARKMGESAA